MTTSKPIISAAHQAKLMKLYLKKGTYNRGLKLNDFDLSINSYAEKIRKKLEEGKAIGQHIYDIPFVSDTKSFILLNYIYTKSMKSFNDLLFIQHYLTLFQTLIVTLFKKKLLTDPKILLAKIAKFLNLELLRKDTVICRYGDPGDKFYLIFKGRIGVLVTKEYHVKMTMEDYVKYLGELVEIKEYELALKTLNSNLLIYYSREIDEIRLKLNGILEGNNGIGNGNNKGNGHGIMNANGIGNGYNSDNEDKDSHTNQQQSLGKETQSIEQYKYDIIPIKDYINRVIPRESITLTKKVSMKTYELTKDNDNDIEENNDSDSDLDSNSKIKEKDNRKTITAWIYFQVAQLEESQTFGDVALSEAISKRTATIICLEDSTCGSLENKIYKRCIRKSQEGIRKLNIECILSNQLFEGIPLEVFNKKYFNYFRLVELSLNDCLFHQGDERTELFFIKEGEVELKTNSSLNDINGIIEHLLFKSGYILPNSNGNNNGNDRDKDGVLRPKEKTIEEQWKQSQMKRSIRLLIHNQRNVVGLDDCMYNNHYFLTAKCQSLKATLYAVDYNFFIKMTQAESNIQKNLVSFLALRNDIMISRLKQINNISVTLKLNAIEEDLRQMTNKNNNKNNNHMCNMSTNDISNGIGNGNEYNHRSSIEYKPKTSIFIKSSLNIKSLKEKLSIIAKDSINNQSLTYRNNNNNDNDANDNDPLLPNKRLTTQCVRESPLFKQSSNDSITEENIITGSRAMIRVKTNADTPIYPHSTKNKEINKRIAPYTNGFNSKGNAKIIALHYNNIRYLDTEETLRLQDTTLGRYIDKSNTIKDSMMLIRRVSMNKGIGNGNNKTYCSSNQLIKLKRNFNKTNKQCNTTVYTNNTEVSGILKGKKLTLNLPKLR